MRCEGGCEGVGDSESLLIYMRHDDEEGEREEKRREIGNRRQGGRDAGRQGGRGGERGRGPVAWVGRY